MSSLIELARIPPETILSISNFLSTDGNWYENSTRSQADEEQTDTEEKVDLNMESLCDDQMDSDTDQVQRNWLKHTLIVACSNLDILAIASAQKIVVFERSERNLMEVVAKVRVTDEENIYISAMTGFGVAPSPSNASSKSLCQDWTCLCIGLSNGRLLFYTERGIFLFSERCTFSSLLSLRLGPSVNPGNQELVALTSDSRLVIIEGLSLCMALRSARTHIAHGERSAEELSNMLQLNAQQLQLERVAQFNDFQLDGLARIAAFDQYTGAYFAGGRTEAVTRTQLPIYAQYVCTIGSRGAAGTASTHQQQQSEREFIAFFWHNTQANSSNLTDALMSITSKISSNLPSFGIRSFLGVGVSRKDRPPKQSLAEMPTTWVYVKSSLRDGKRMSERSFLAPYGWHLVAITDNVGRILLINTRTRRILRIWKGYRQARCAWIEASSTAQQKVVKTLFLVIFAPRRGLLEVWSVQNGPRVSAFEVGEYGRLLSIPSAQFGILHGMDQSCDFPQSACSSNAIFLSPDGSLYELKVPFHLSALDASTALVHDENLIKQFMMSQAEMDIDQQLLDLFGKLRTEIGRFNFMGILLKSIDIPTNSLVNLISALAKQRSIDCEKNPTSPNKALSDPIIRKASKSSHVNFSKFVNNLSQATELYQKLDQLLKEALQPQMECNTGEEEIAATDQSPKHWQFLFPSAGSAHPNITKALDIFALVQGVESSSSNSHEAMAKFVSDHQLNLREFVLCFTSTKSPASSTGNRLVAEEESNSKNSPDLELKFATTFLTPFLMMKTDPSSNTLFSQLLTGLALAEPVRFFLTFMLNNDCNQYLNGKFTLRSYQMLKVIFDFSAENDPSKIVGLIKTVEKAIIESTNTMAALILALQMNVLQHELLRDLGVSTISRDNTESKETFLVLDEVHLELQAAIQDSDANFWTLAALHLGALSLLRMFIAQLANAKAVNGGSMSLAKLAQKGASFFREQIGFSISQNEDPSIGVQQILSSFHCETSIDQMTSPADENPNSSSSALAVLCSLFPQSMCTELLIGDCVWECASAWYRNGYRELSKLKRSVDLLEQLTIVPRMQHGLAIMIWEAFLSQTFEKLFHLMEKQLGERNFDGSSSAGHFYPLAGTDWMLRRDVLVTEADLPSYLFCVRRLLDLLATASCRIEGRRDLAYGPLAGTVHHLEDPLINEFLALPGVKNFARNSEREPATLFQLADRQKQANYHLVVHHLHLATVMDLLVNLPLECYTKPSTLFDPIGKRAFFTAFNTHPLLPMSRVDDRTKMRRQRFVEYCKEAIERGSGKPDSERCAEVLDFLVKEWALDVTNLQIKEIARLYLHGNDKEAEVRCSQLTGNRKKLALELIPIIAARIKMLIERDDRLMDKILKNAAASESTLAFIKDVQEEHMPQGEEPTEIDSAKIRKMIVVAKTCAKEKRQKLPTEHNSSTDYSNKCQQLFKDFDEIVSIAQWLEEANPS